MKLVRWSLPCLALAACISQNPPPVIHFFHPALPDLAVGAGPEVSLPLSLGRINSAAYLHEDMVWRISEVEIGFDDLNRWVQDPSLLLQEALEVVLYQEAGFEYSTSPEAINVDVHLRRFEERPGEEPEVCVQFLATVRRGLNAAPARRDIHVHEPMEQQGAEAAASAMGVALYRAARELADFLRE